MNDSNPIASISDETQKIFSIFEKLGFEFNINEKLKVEKEINLVRINWKKEIDMIDYLREIGLQNKYWITFDYEYIDPSSQYVDYLIHFVNLTKGEAEIKNATIEIENNIEILKFEINGNFKLIELDEPGLYSPNMIKWVLKMPHEFGLNGKYYAVNTQSQDSIIFYFSQEKATEFERLTGLKLEDDEYAIRMNS